MLAIRRNIAFRKVNIIPSFPGILETICIEIPASPKPLLIASIYKHPGPSDSLLWENFFTSFNCFTSAHIIITGDFNAHHTSWGSHHSDSSGKLLLESSQEHHFFPINDGTPTRLSHPRNSPSVIDLTFVSSSTTPFAFWESYEDSLGSDHIPSIIRINLTVKNVSLYSHKLNLSELDWKSFQSLLITLAPDLLLQLRDPDISHLDKYEILFNSIKNSAISLTSQKHKNQHRIPFTNHNSPSKNVFLLLHLGGMTHVRKRNLKNKPFAFSKGILLRKTSSISRGRKPLQGKSYALRNARVGDPFVKRSLLLLR